MRWVYGLLVALLLLLLLGWWVLPEPDEDAGAPGEGVDVEKVDPGGGMPPGSESSVRPVKSVLRLD